MCDRTNKEISETIKKVGEKLIKNADYIAALEFDDIDFDMLTMGIKIEKFSGVTMDIKIERFNEITIDIKKGFNI